ncbi:MAG TPA: 3-hydroxyacyl-CoA dehydrogenase family protein [Solirubrobacteraceae bacterium]|nr:3-hydroxyacyl-CoA dehydrogenase family protein [Solirubrobacteraceae bacterium]
MSLDIATVVGSGRTAPTIAAAFAAAGLQVRLAARDQARARAAAELASTWSGRRVDPCPLGEGAVAGADLVLESIAEEREAKAALYRDVERWAKPDAVLATNTSSLSITALAAGLAAPERFAGLHFLHPAHETAVVEIIAGERTAEQPIATLRELAGRMGKTPIVARCDVPGFVWNRLQFALLRECLHLIEEGVADAPAIEAAICEGLAPRWLATGPLATADLGGIRTFATIAEQLFPVLSAAREVPPALAARERFFEWTPASEAAVAALRAEALDAARPLFAERRARTPPSA